MAHGNRDLQTKRRSGVLKGAANKRRIAGSEWPEKKGGGPGGAMKKGKKKAVDLAARVYTPCFFKEDFFEVSFFSGSGFHFSLSTFHLRQFEAV